MPRLVSHSYSQEAPHQQYQQQSQPEQHQAEQHHAQQHEQGVQTSFSQPPPNLFQQQNAFSRYPANSSPYGHAQHQQPEDHSAAPSPYAPFKPESVSSPYFQHPAASHSPAPGQAPQAPQQSSYGAFNSVPQQAPGQQAPFASSQSDYSALYGQDALRNMVRARPLDPPLPNVVADELSPRLKRRASTTLTASKPPRPTPSRTLRPFPAPTTPPPPLPTRRLPLPPRRRAVTSRSPVRDSTSSSSLTA